MRAKAGSAKPSLAGKANPSLSNKSTVPFYSMRSPAERWLSLQGAAGNQAVQKVRAKLTIGQAKPVDPIPPRVSPEIDPAQLEGFGGQGQAMPDPVRSYFEPRFGRDLRGVRLHTDSGAAQLSRSLNARAFTVGRDLFFGAGEYAPHTVEGKRLIAHELAHLFQQAGGPSVVRRKIKFDTPAYNRINPIERILGNLPVGYTTPTVNGSPLPNDFMQAGELLFKALQPPGARHDPKTKGCSFNDFDVTVSANVIIPIEPEEGGWSMRLPGSGIAGTAACRDKKSVPVTMIGKPSHEAAGKWIEKNEEEHVDDLKKLYGKYLKPHFDWLMKLTARSEEAGKCGDVLLKAIGDKDAVAVRDFLKDLIEAVQKRDEGGKHSLSNKINVKENCARIEIESTKK